MDGSTERPPLRVTVLAGGVGAARFLRGLYSLPEATDLVIVGNTADDEEFFGLHVSPDLDTVLYTLAGRADPRRGWGIRGDTFRCLAALGRYFGPTWFRLGDGDLATHIYRTHRLRCGAPLSAVTAELAAAHGLRARLVPMTDERVRTEIRLRGAGWVPFQDYLVRRRGCGEVQGIRFSPPGSPRPAPGVRAALRSADAIVIPPSNPLVSIGPILAVGGVRELLRARRARVAAVSPLVGGRPVKGPLHRMMRGLGLELSAVGIARLYAEVASVLVLDRADARYAERVAALGMRPVVAPTVMRTPAAARRLARTVLDAVAASAADAPARPSRATAG